jgi:hypothetical protein
MLAGDAQKNNSITAPGQMLSRGLKREEWEEKTPRPRANGVA